MSNSEHSNQRNSFCNNRLVMGYASFTPYRHDFFADAIGSSILKRDQERSADGETQPPSEDQCNTIAHPPMAEPNEALPSCESHDATKNKLLKADTYKELHLKYWWVDVVACAASVLALAIALTALLLRLL
jgi:hypothetical protein